MESNNDVVVSDQGLYITPKGQSFEYFSKDEINSVTIMFVKG